jgi:hypothetical protein
VEEEAEFFIPAAPCPTISDANDPSRGFEANFDKYLLSSVSISFSSGSCVSSKGGAFSIMDDGGFIAMGSVQYKE